MIHSYYTDTGQTYKYALFRTILACKNGSFNRETTGAGETERKMVTNRKIDYIHEPTDLQCGQAVLAMITGLTVEAVVQELGNDRETTLKEMKGFLRSHGAWVSDIRVQVVRREELPPLCLLSLETPRCWHWSLYCDGVFYDPEHGVSDDFPVCARKYYWEIRL